VERRQIQRLAAQDLDPATFSELAAHGEDLLVERKAQLPEPERLGAAVASMANMLGGWLLLGVDDKSRELEDLVLPRGVDLQSHIGQLLRNAVDPVPPFLAGSLDVDGMRVGFVRVFHASVPVLAKGSGAIYLRDDGGKQPVADHRQLLDLARAGSEAEDEARRRPDRNSLTQAVLGLPSNAHGMMEFHMRAVVRAAPLTVTPQLAEWPVTRGAGVCLDAAEWLARKAGAPDGFTTEIRPHGRAVAAFASQLSPRPIRAHQAVAVAACDGIFGVSISREVNNVMETHQIRRDWIRPAIEGVYSILDAAEALGDAVVDLHLIHSREITLVSEEARKHPLPNRVYCGGAVLTLPADEEDRVDLGRLWEREVGRTAGIALWETP
jgi:hypothetical protein